MNFFKANFLSMGAQSNMRVLLFYCNCVLELPVLDLYPSKNYLFGLRVKSRALKLAIQLFWLKYLVNLRPLC